MRFLIFISVIFTLVLCACTPDHSGETQTAPQGQVKGAMSGTTNVPAAMPEAAKKAAGVTGK